VQTTVWWVQRITVTVGLLLVGALVLLAIWAFMLHDPREDIDLAGWVGSGDSWHESMMPSSRWATDELCDAELPCIQAVTSETLTMYRFEERSDAVTAAESFGADGYLTGWIAVRYEPGALSESERYNFEYSISCINTFVGEEGQDC
jgi:hypothetical protein